MHLNLEPSTIAIRNSVAQALAVPPQLVYNVSIYSKMRRLSLGALALGFKNYSMDIDVIVPDGVDPKAIVADASSLTVNGSLAQQALVSSLSLDFGIQTSYIGQLIAPYTMQRIFGSNRSSPSMPPSLMPLMPHGKTDNDTLFGLSLVMLGSIAGGTAAVLLIFVGVACL